MYYITYFISSLFVYNIWCFDSNIYKSPCFIYKSNNLFLELSLIISFTGALVVLVTISVSSIYMLDSLYNSDFTFDLIIKVSGYQWFWGYSCIYFFSHH